MEKNQRFVSTLSVKAYRLCQLPRGGSQRITEDGPRLCTTSQSRANAVTAPLVGEPLAGDSFFAVIACGSKTGICRKGKKLTAAEQKVAKRIRSKTQRYAKASPTRGGGIERSDDDGEVVQSSAQQKTALPCNARQSGVSPVLITVLPEPFSGSWRSGRGSWWGGGRRWYPTCGRWHPQPSCP